MRITARLAYGLDALVDLAAADEPVKGDVLAARHGVSVGFLENILAELRRGGVVHSKRGGNGGYWLARPPDQITVADVILTLDGARAFETATAPGRLSPVWETIARATFDAAEEITVAAVARAERVGPCATGDAWEFAVRTAPRREASPRTGSDREETRYGT